MTSAQSEPYLKYALFCRDTEEGPGGELILKDVVDLIDLPPPTESGEANPRIVAEIDVNLAFCIAGATPGSHHTDSRGDRRQPGLLHRRSHPWQPS